MRVAVNVEQLLYRTPGGTGRYTARLVSLLTAVFPDDTVVPFTAWHRRETAERAFRTFGLPVTASARWARLPVTRRVLFDAWNVLALPALPLLSPSLRSVDLVHAPSVAVPPRRRVPLVVTVHDAAPALFPGSFPRHGRWFHERGFDAAARRADLVITVSRSAAAEIVSNTAIPEARVRVVPNGVDHEPARPEEVAATLERHGLDDGPYVLWVGTFEPRKNLGTLVTAFAKAVSTGTIAHRLVLVGPRGWLGGELIAPGVQDRLGGRLRKLGAVSEPELRALYSGADLFALPSRHEGFGLPVLEAMVQGTPVLSADIPALREVAGDAALFVPPDDVDGWAEALVRLVTDAGLRRDLIAAGRLRASEFSWERTARGTRGVYLEALGRAG